MFAQQIKCTLLEASLIPTLSLSSSAPVLLIATQLALFYFFAVFFEGEVRAHCST